MVIYRIEHEENGFGPYQNFITYGEHYNTTRCPSPWADGIACNPWKSHYGFKSKKDLLNWFGKTSVWQFRSQQHYVYKYRVPDEAVACGEKHVAFNRGRATKLGKVPMYKLMFH